MATSNIDLCNALTQAEPLGPIDHTRIVNDDLVYDKISFFSELSGKPHMLYLGRKGSGKSALLSEIRRETRKEGRRSTWMPDEELKEKSNYVIDVSSWEHFKSIADNVSRQYLAGSIIDELIPPEYFAKLWYEILWDEIIQHFYNYHAYDEVRELLKPVDQYVTLDGITHNRESSRQQATTIFDSAKTAVLKFLKERDSKLYFLFDSMENYPIRHRTFEKIISGLFQGLTKISDDSPKIIVSFCIPEEIESFITSESANLMKDLSSSFRIRWQPVDLIRIVAHRLRFSASIYDKKLHSKLKELDFTKRDDLHQVFNLILPRTLSNQQNTEEDPLAYIIRHTQLLPRHILAIFNSALSYHHKQTNSFEGMSTQSVLKGVSDTQMLIAKHILIPYEQLYPKLLKQCKTVLPDLEPICDYSTLRKIESRFDRLIEDDITSIWSSLFEIGIIGRSTGKSGIDSHELGRNERYCYGQFHFNIDGAFGLATDGEYCFHPVFSRAFAMVRRSKDMRVVYPAHINWDNLYE